MLLALRLLVVQMLMCDVRSERMCHGFNVLSAHEERGSERLAGRILGGKVLREGLLRGVYRNQ
jgi:hypothetical protein